MNDNNVTPIAAMRPIPPKASEEIERQRVRLFRAINLVQTTANAMEAIMVERAECIAEHGTLEAAVELMNDIAFRLNDISGHNGPLPEETES